MDIIRVFPSQTKATPDDDMAFVGDPPLYRPTADEVHISCTFTWDKPEAERLQRAWSKYYDNIKLGGPAYDDPGGNFTPGMYLKEGYVITTRGCPNHCSFCYIPKREGQLRCLPITDGNDVADNNLLAAPRQHIESVLEMLNKQKKAARFTGGLEAVRVESWIVSALADIRVECLFLSYDRPAQKDHIDIAISMFKQAGFSRHKLYCYVLVGYKGDTIVKAGKRLQFILSLGAIPFGMYFRDDKGPKQIPKLWQSFVRLWIRPALMFQKERITADAGLFEKVK